MSDVIIIIFIINIIIVVTIYCYHYHLYIIIQKYENVVTNPLSNCCLTLVKLSPRGEIVKCE